MRGRYSAYLDWSERLRVRSRPLKTHEELSWSVGEIDPKPQRHSTLRSQRQTCGGSTFGQLVPCELGEANTGSGAGNDSWDADAKRCASLAHIGRAGGSGTGRDGNFVRCQHAELN